ncbi:MAG: DNA/RNA non-specific endonuclease [Treponema sp.]|nr:DNA/RNA non-specific endonuclease [Treponema sp.]
MFFLRCKTFYNDGFQKILFTILCFLFSMDICSAKGSAEIKSVDELQMYGVSSEADLGYGENDPLFFGNPSDAVTDLKHKNNYLLEKKQFVVSYNAEKLIPNWVAWHLCSNDVGYIRRSNDFRSDETLPKQFYAVTDKDFQFSIYGFERGHLCPSGERTTNAGDNSATFLMTNIVPQSSDSNQGVWNYLENYERSLALDGYELYIFAGTLGSGGTSSKGYYEFIPVKNNMRITITVPSSMWKIIIAIKEGTDDFNRIDENVLCIAVIIPNKTGISKKGGWQQFACSIDDIEKITGYDFFELLPDEIESKIEEKVYGKK